MPAQTVTHKFHKSVTDALFLQYLTVLANVMLVFAEVLKVNIGLHVSVG